MFRKKPKESGKQEGSTSKKSLSFAYEIPPEHIDPNSDFGNPNFDNANSITTQVRFKELLDKIKLILSAILGVLLITVTALAFVLIFATDYEIAYLDDGTSLMCLVE